MTDPLAIALLDALDRDPDALEQLRAKLGEASGMLEPWVGVHEAATHLNCRPHRVYDLVSNRVIPYRKDGSRLLFRLSELDEWLTSLVERPARQADERRRTAAPALSGRRPIS